MNATAAIVKVWEFHSKTSSRVYQTIKYSDRTLSCNCPGWTRRVQPNGERSCRHTRSVDMGTADAQCDACKDYGDEKKKEEVKHITSLGSGRRLNI
jgi:predicted nucleic acid-binding Zn finger protein